MIRVDLGKEVLQRNKASKWHWRIAGTSLEGVSREPLFDACRMIKRTGCQDSSTAIGLFRLGREIADLSCSVDVGSRLTVVENEKYGPRFAKWRPRPELGLP
jgi:hypothetical protein